jgi:hypothetical protein
MILWRSSTVSLLALALLVLLGCARGQPKSDATGGSSAMGSVPHSLPNVSSSVGSAVFQAVVRQKNYRVEFGRYALEVDPTDGGRTVVFSLDGKNFLLTRAESSDAYGSSFWPSPQSDWNWPPPIELDRAAWTVSEGSITLTLNSGTNAKLGLSAEQRISTDPVHGSVVIDYTLHNRGTESRRVAPWQNTRVHPGGVTFFPSSTPSLAKSTLRVAPEAGMVWFRHDPAVQTKSVKTFVDGLEGWLAQIHGDLLFVKVFPDIPPAAQAPGEAEIEIYVDQSGKFVEMEQQGAYSELLPGASSSWQVRWILRRLPAGVAAEPKNAKLVDLVRKLVGELRESSPAVTEPHL